MILKRLKFTVTFIAICLGLWLVFFFSRNEPQAEESKPNETIVGDSTSEILSPSEADTVSRDEVTEKEAATRMAERYRELHAKRNADIEFFGKVVDQYGSGIEACTVVVQISGSRMPKLITDSETFEFSKELKTDRNGMFVVEGFRGEALRILDIKKEGYILQKGGRFSFTYGTLMGGRYTPDDSSPVIYQMAKISANTKLIMINERVDVKANQSEVLLPLRLGASNAPLNFKFSFDRTATASSNGYDWSYAVRLVDGSIQEAEDGTLLLAPVDGYKQSIEQEFTAGSPNWTMRSQKLLYLRHANGTSCAGIELTVFSYKDGRSRIIVKGNFNPNGRLVVESQ
jgi:hypothetical protein